MCGATRFAFDTHAALGSQEKMRRNINGSGGPALPPAALPKSWSILLVSNDRFFGAQFIKSFAFIDLRQHSIAF